jgi:hypothetical protein
VLVILAYMCEPLRSIFTEQIVANPRLIERALDDLWESSSDKVFALGE